MSKKWRPDEEPPADFLELLYDSESEGDPGDYEEAMHAVGWSSSDEDDEAEEARPSSPEAPSYSPLTSPERRERSPRMDEQEPSTCPRPASSPESLLDPTESSLGHHRNFWKRCVVCFAEGRKCQKTPYCCESCRVPLCIKECFKSYHTPSQ